MLDVVRPEPRKLLELKRRSGLHPTRVTVIVAELVEQGHLRKEAVGRSQQYVHTGRSEPPDLSRYRTQHAVRTAGLDAMQAYADASPDCLMRTLRHALGDREAEPCGRCGVCRGANLDLPAPTGAAAVWMADQPTVIPGNRSGLAPGRAVYDSQRRSEGFQTFMRSRSAQPRLPDDARERLVAAARALPNVAAVVPLPSATWAQRDDAAGLVAEALGVPRIDVLHWQTAPEHRQGQLLNNDQRRANVKGFMVARGALPDGRLLLLDDYTGSGATLNEAVRSLKKGRGHEGGCVPLTVARVRWRLGRPGIV
ncbi:MAG: RecQ family zinc-binding domain-containing protein [Myxococcota bacterium]